MTQKYDSIEFTLAVGAVIVDEHGRQIRHLGNGRFTTPIVREERLIAGLQCFVGPKIFTLTETLRVLGEQSPPAMEGVLSKDPLSGKDLARGISLLTYQDPESPEVRLTERGMSIAAGIATDEDYVRSGPHWVGD